MSLPTVDLAPFLSDPASASAHTVTEDLLRYGHDPGFVYLAGHGVDSSLENQLLAVSKAFFALPADARTKLAIENSPAFRGYTLLGDERTGGVADWRDQLDFGPDQDAPPPGHDGPAWLRLRGPNQWPTELPHMASIALEWLEQMHGVGLAVLRALATGLGQTTDYFDSGFVPTHDIHGKIIRYPVRAESNQDANQGVGLHHDTGLLTFILQDSVAGLQVMIDGELVTVAPKRGTYVLNLGAMMQTATSGYLRATPHRVLTPSSGLDRISIALFFNPTYESVYEPMELPADLAANAVPDRRDLNGDTIRTLFGENNLKVRLRSHPDVARRHYSDIGGSVRSEDT